MTNDVNMLRDVIAKTVKMLARDGIAVTQRGAQAYCQFDLDGKPISINIPMIPDAPSKEFVRALQGFIDHEVAHALFTDGKLLVDTVIEEEASATVRSMNNIVEDIRIEGSMSNHFAGAAANLTDLLKYMSEKVWAKPVAQVNASALPQDQKERMIAGLLLVPFLRARGGHKVCSDLLDDTKSWDVFKKIDDAMPDLADRLSAMTSTRDAHTLAGEIYAIIKGEPPEAEDAPEEEQDSDEKSDKQPGESKKSEPKDGDKSEDEKSEKDEPTETDTKPTDDEEPGEDAKDPDQDEDGEKEPSEEGGEDEDSKSEDDGAGSDEDKDDADKGDSEGQDADAEGDAGEDDADDQDSGTGEDDQDAEDGEDDQDDGESGEGDGEEADDQDGAGGDSSEPDQNESEGKSGGKGKPSGQHDDVSEDSDETSDEQPTQENTGTEPNGDEEPVEVEQPKLAGAEGGGGGKGAPLEIDMSLVKDTDEALEEVIKTMLNGAFSTVEQVCFSRDFDKVGTYEYDKDDEIDVRPIEEEVRRLGGTVQGELQRLMVARSQSYYTPGFRSGRLNGASLHRLAAGDDRIFRRKHEAKTNKVAVSLVVDLSGSMSGDKVRTALIAAWTFSEVLDRIGVKNEVCGFSDYSANNSEVMKFNDEIADFIKSARLKHGQCRIYPFWMPIFKEYDERFTPETKRRLTHMAVHQNGMVANNDALAVKYAGDRLMRRTEPRKIMIVLSDGSPAAHGIDQGIQERSLRNGIERLEKAGAEVIGIGIQDESVKRYYKNNMIINKPEDLPRVVIREMRDLLVA